jgi:hypothetical protein
MGLLIKMFRKRSPKVTYLDEYKRQKRKEALEELPYMDEREWKRKYKRHLKDRDYRF